MNVKKLIEILTKEVKLEDMENAEIEIWSGDQEYEIFTMSGLGLSPEIVIQLKEITSPIMKPAIFKKEHADMVDQKKKEIFAQNTDGEWEDEEMKTIDLNEEYDIHTLAIKINEIINFINVITEFYGKKPRCKSMEESDEMSNKGL